MTELRRYEKLWRTALHVTSSAFVVAILGLGTATPVAHAAAVAATLGWGMMVVAAAAEVQKEEGEHPGNLLLPSHHQECW